MTFKKPSAISRQLSVRRLLAPCCLIIAFLLAPCPLLLAQSIVPHRDIQKVDSLNRGKPTAAPVTVIKKGYAQITRSDGLSYWAHIGRYIQDSLSGVGSNWTDIGGSIYPMENDSVYIPDTFDIAAGTGILNVSGRFDLRFPDQEEISMAIGQGTLFNNTSGGIENIAIGHQALFANETGDFNLALGLAALYANETGSNNLALGHSSQANSTLGIDNVSLGTFSMFTNLGGSGNLAIGHNAGYYSDGSDNIFIGNNSGYYASGTDGKLYIDNSNTLTPLIYGDLAGDSIKINGHLGFTQSGSIATTLIGRDASNYLVPVGYGDGLDLIDNQLEITGGSDSLYQIPDSLCFIIMGDTTCASLDSIAYYETEVCFWSMGDTTCIPFVNEGINIYNSNGALTADRTVTLNNNYLRFIQSGTQNGVDIRPTGNFNMVRIRTDYNDAARSALQLSNNAFVGTERNAYIRYDQGTTSYAMGLDNSTPQGFTLSDSFNLKNPVFKYYSNGPSGGTAGDSLVFFKRTKFRSTLLDKDGDAGTSGQVLSSTGTGIDWITGGGGDHDWYESGDTAPNAITDEMYHTGDVHVGDATMAQTGKLNVEGLMKMRATSTNTSIFLGGGNLTLSGTENIGIGNSAGEDLTSGAYNILIGFRAGRNVTANGNGNILIGREAGDALTTGAGNVVIGSQTAINNDYNEAVVIGYAAGVSADVDSSTIVGYLAGKGASNGGHRGNTILGYYAGSEMTGSGNVYIGKRAGYGLSNSNRLVIDNNASSEKFITGDFSADTLRFNAGVSIKGTLELSQGADVASVAGAITLGSDGNVFEVTGTNAITLISNVGKQNGTEITLVFTSTASLTDGTANSGTNIGMELEGNANFTGSADDIVKLTLCEMGGVQRWRMSGKSVN